MGNACDPYVSYPKEVSDFYKSKKIWDEQTMGEIIKENAHKYRDNIFLIDKRTDSRITYKEFDLMTDKIANGFIENNILMNDKVLIQLPNIKEFFLVAFSLFKIGAVPIFILPSHRENEIKHIINLSKATTYITMDSFQGFDYKSIAKNLNDINVFMLGNSEGFRSFNELYTERKYNYPKPNADDLFLLQLSGGTTGMPKLIPRIHNDYLYSIKRSNEICQITEKDIYLTVLPVCHNFTMSSPGSFGVFISGGTVVLNINPSPDECFKIIEEEKVTFTSLVPSLMIVWNQAKELGFLEYDLSSLNYIQVGGSKFKSTLVKKSMKNFNCRFQQVFGMAEGLVNYTDLNDCVERIINTQGKPMSPYDEVKVVNENGEEIPNGEMGLLIVRGPYTIRGYYNSKKQNRKSFTKDGYYITGDLVSIDEEGYITVEGREKDTIVRGGENISAEEIENLILSHEKIIDVAVVGFDDQYLGEKICAFIVSNEIVTLSEIKIYLRNLGLASYKLPEKMIDFKRLPLSGVGKINKKKLREYLKKGEI